MSDKLERLAGALSDRYRIDRELGAGGMATVYLAEDLKTTANLRAPAHSRAPRLGVLGKREMP